MHRGGFVSCIISMYAQLMTMITAVKFLEDKHADETVDLPIMDTVR